VLDDIIILIRQFFFLITRHDEIFIDFRLIVVRIETYYIRVYYYNITYAYIIHQTMYRFINNNLLSSHKCSVSGLNRIMLNPRVVKRLRAEFVLNSLLSSLSFLQQYIILL